MTIEHRSVLECRAVGNTLIGLAVPFDQVAHVGGFDEVVRPGAFAETLASERDVLLLLDHDAKRVLARRSAGALRLAESQRGLVFEAELNGTSWASDALALSAAVRQVACPSASGSGPRASGGTARCASSGRSI